MESATVLIVRAAVVLLGFKQIHFRGVSFAAAFTLVLLPVVVSQLPRFRLASTICVLGVLAIPSGYMLAEASSVDHHVNGAIQVALFLLLLSGMAGMMIILWARRLIPLNEVILLFGLGSLANEVLFSDRRWKFDLAIPVIIVALSLAERYGSRVLSAIVVMVLGVVSILDDGRSLFGICVIAALLTIWQMLGSGGGRRRSRWRTLVLVTCVGLGIYMVGSSMLTAGVFGSELQQRSTQQIESSGSLIVGGRPEWSATRELAKLRPLGYGTGVVPSWSDLRAGREGFASINVAPDAYGYLENFVLGARFELHSIFADLWVQFGLVGAGLGMMMTLAMGKGLVTLVTNRAAPTNVLFVAVLSLWFMGFGTPRSNWMFVCVVTGFLLLERAPSGPVPSE